MNYFKIEYEKTTEDWYRLLVIFQPMGHRCGYVGVPEDHITNGSEYYDFDDDVSEIQKQINDIKVHGGLTYAKRNKDMFGDDKWYFGFDCIHYEDAKDYESAFEYFKDDPEIIKRLKSIKKIDEKFPSINNGIIRDLDYVKKEVKYLYEQLKAIK